MRARPNFVVFIPDQLRFDAVGCSGNPVAYTPNIDALAARGTRFQNAWSQHSVCGPSRVSFMTGWYPHVLGHRTLTHLLKPWDPNLLGTLREGGYYVAHAGLRGDTFARGVTKDCTDRFGYAVRPNMVYMRSPWERDHRYARAYYHGRRPHDGPALDFDEACTRTAEEWLDEGMTEPWCLYVPLVFPHPPFEVEEPWFSMHDRSAMPEPVPPDFEGKPRYMRALHEKHGLSRMDRSDWAEVAATYYGMVSRVDDQLGRVMRAVDRAGAAGRTTTIFFTDHGEYLGDYGLVEKWPAGQHDVLLHNPMIVAAAGAPGGNVAESFVELIDLVPTMLEMAEIEAGHTHFGKSFCHLLEDASRAHRDAAFSEGGFATHEEALLERADFPYDLKAALQREDPISVGKVVTVRTEDWTYAHRLYEHDELYDRKKDPRELANLSGRPEYREVERELRDRVLDWLFATSDVIPWETDPRFDAEGAVEPRIEEG